MSFASVKFPTVLLLSMVATAASQQSAGAADLPESYRERPRVVRTTYISRQNLECSLLRVTEQDGSRIVRVCYPPLDLRPSVGGGSSSGDVFDRSSFTVTQSGVFTADPDFGARGR